MGFEVTIVVALLFVSALVLGTVSYTALSASSDVVSGANSEQHIIQNKRMHTSIRIDSAHAVGTGSGYDLTVTLTNTGSETLQFNELNILIDGHIEHYSFNEADKVWVPVETRELTIQGLHGTGEHRIKIVTENGVSVYGTYVA